MTHFSEIDWQESQWPNFSPAEVSCYHCGEIHFDEEDYDAIQRVRSILNRPVELNSAHRCAIHNARVGGAPLSRHKKNAFDISINGHDLGQLLNAAREAGFTGFGFYGTFLHVDRGRPRQWSTSAGKATWDSLLTS